MTSYDDLIMAVVYGYQLFTTVLRKSCLIAISSVEPLELNIWLQTARFDFFIIIIQRCRNGELAIVL